MIQKGLQNSHQRSTLRQNEQSEAHAFDRFAERCDNTKLRTSDWTFSRYRSATFGKPVFDAYPDLVFSYIGSHLLCKEGSQKPLQGVRILDLGAGDGEWSVILAEQGADVVSVEISPKQVELARERMRIHNLSWNCRIGSAYELRNMFPQGSFDLIFGQGVLHHLTYDLECVYAGIHYLLREGGYATFTEPYSGSRLLRGLRENLSWMIPIDRVSPDERPLTPADISLLGSLFSNIEIDYFDLLAKFARRIFHSYYLARFLFPLDRLLLRTGILHPFATMISIKVRR